MRTKNLLKLAFTMMAMFVITGAMAQTYPTPLNHTEDTYDYTVVDETIYQTTGYGLTLYVAPDPAYSPDYDGTGARGTDLNATSQWRWVYDAAAYDDGGTETEVKTWANENWVTIAAGGLPAAGNSRIFFVLERFGAAGCLPADATATQKTVAVLAAPDATMVGANTGSDWEVETADRVFYRCGEGYVDNLTLTFTEAGTPIPTYVWDITATVEGFDANDASVGAAVAAGAQKIVTVADITAVANGDFIATGGDNWNPEIPAVMNFLTHDFGAGAVNVRTKYVFTLNNIASRISAISQKRAGVATAYFAPTVAQTVTYWLNLPPVTGPIYHIPNNYAFQ